MAFDVKSRAKRYEKLDFLGEGQVRLRDWTGRTLRGSIAPTHSFAGFLVEARGLAWLLHLLGWGQAAHTHLLPVDAIGVLEVDPEARSFGRTGWSGAGIARPHSKPPRVLSEPWVL